MATLVVAALSARTLAEAAMRDGHTVIALDLYGDADTRAACQQWQPLGEPGALQIDAQRLMSSLATAAAMTAPHEVLGWLPGTGFEGCPELLEQGARHLPLIGNTADTVRRVRDPRQFFGLLAQHGVLHPDWQTTPPAPLEAAGWLRKDARAAGGVHIQRCDRLEGNGDELPDPHVYFQRAMPGTSLSATFIANGHSACVLGINALMVQAWEHRPHVYGGAIGPVPVPTALAAQVTHALAALVPALGLRGLGSLDVLWDGQRVWVLEINPRPTASMALYPTLRFRCGEDGATHGLLQAHLQACLQGQLPVPVARPARPSDHAVRGTAIIYAPQALHLSAAQTDALARRPDTHDLPAGPARLARGEPLCSVSAAGPSAHAVRTRLRDAREALLLSLEH